MIDTDYTNHAIVYSCKNYYGLWRFESIWVLMRKPLERGTPEFN